MAEDLPLDLKPNGTISLSVGQKPYRLRRPKFGELRDLWEAFEDAAEQHDALTASLGAEPSREQEKEARAERFAIWAGWQRKVFDKLADTPLPSDDDELEGWLMTAGVAGQFLTHWQGRPLASG